VVAKVGERLAVSKLAAQKFDGKDLISRRQMSWTLGNIIKLRLQAGFLFWRTEMTART